MDKKKLSDWIYKNCKWVQALSTHNESFIQINIPLDNPYFPRLGSWNHAEKRIFNDLQKGVIKIEERI